MQRRSLLEQLSDFLTIDELDKLKRCTGLFSLEMQEKIMLWLLFECKFRSEPVISDKKQAFIYKIIKNEIFN